MTTIDKKFQPVVGTMANEMAKEDWKLCVDWLIRCQLITEDHKVASPNSEVFDLAQLLRDGVLICHLLNRLHPCAVDPKDFSQRPQMSQFLCLKNINIFLQTCKMVFKLKNEDLFDIYDLFEIRNFGKVITTLSILSHTPEAQKTNILSFSVNPKKHSLYYNTLPNLASLAEMEDEGTGYQNAGYDVDREDVYEDLCVSNRNSQMWQSMTDEPLYGVVDNDHDEGDVYGRLVDLLPPVTKDPLPRSKRELCIKELVVTEKNYIDALLMIKEHFMKPLKEIIPLLDYNIIFMCIESLHTVHSGFHGDLMKACSVQRDGALGIMIPDCFIIWKEKFLIYGEYCSNLPKAQELLDKLCDTNALIQQRVLESQMAANEGRFKLRDLLSVPMQRVLKYHLFLKELIKNTDRSHIERRSLERALEEMQDLSLYVNEVKRDNETLHLLSEIEASIIDYQLPDNTTLKDYGRLLKDGELKLKAHSDNKTKTRYAFLFDKVMLLCKPKGENYSYKNALVVCNYEVEELIKEKERNFGFAFILGEKNRENAYTVGCKTPELRTKWMEAFQMAQENTSPQFAHYGCHDFAMASFKEATICDVCRKLLRGVFFQGYKCQKTNMIVHKECIEKAKDLSGPPKPPPKPTPCRSLSLAARPERLSKGKVKVLCSYLGIPVPSNGRPALPIEVDEIIDLLSDEDSYWWEGRFIGREGFFPKECVRLVRDTGCNNSLSRPAIVQRTPSFDAHASPPNQSIPAVQSRLPPRLNQTLSGSMLLSCNTEGLEGCPWFAGSMSRDEASRSLERLPNGTYLVRVSQSDMRKGEFALSIKYGRGHPVKHIKIQKGSDGSFFIADCKMFRTVLDLILFYQQNSLQSSFPEVPTVLQIPYKDALSQKKATADDSGVLGYCYATYDYSAMEPNQLSLRHGDRVAIVSKACANRGWWRGRLNGKVGFFPSAFVAECEDGDGTILGFNR